MKILHVIDTLDPAFGGPSVSSPSTAAAQAADGHEVTILCHSDESFDKHLNVLQQNIPGIKAVKIISVSNESLWDKYLSTNAKLKLNTLIPEQDVVHLQGVWRPILLCAARIAKKSKVRYVISPRGMLDPWSLRQKYWKKKLALWLGWRDALNNAHFIHALNSEEAELIGPLKLSADIKILPNGAFPEKFSNLPAAEQFRNEFKEIKNDPYILFLSRIHYKKGLDFLVKAFSKLSKTDPSIQLVVAGPDEGHLDEIAHLVTKLGISERIHIVGPLYGEVKFSAMVGAVCFCLPSRQEGFSMAITEALACGTPVVISSHCHFDEVSKSNAGRVVNLDVDEIVSALKDVITLGADDWRDLSKNAKKLVMNNFSWYSIAKKMVSAYDTNI